ncbi:MAG: tig [Verrucomicrobia bacterium]|jgi:trigger factor|nr:tig [Verrucomicrobiota bacterium]
MLAGSIALFTDGKDIVVNVTVETLAPCKKLLRVEVDVQTVDAAFENTTKEFQRFAQLPGFRPGKAPRDLVLKSYAGKIEEEVKKKLIPDSYRKALEQEKLKPVVYPDIEEIQFGKGQSLQFAATIETEPEFELPEYKGLEIKREKAVVTDADVERAINTLRDQRATYTDVEREVKTGDYVVVNYTGTSEGKPLTEIAPTAKGLTKQENFWMNIAKDQFIPGFTEQLVGAKKGETVKVTVDFPADFVSQPLAGKKGEYQVTINQVKEKGLPEVNEEFAKSWGAEDLDKLKEGVKNDLQNELNKKQSESLSRQVLQALFAKVSYELPETVVNSETRNLIYNVVNENQRRGVDRDTIETHKDQIFASANTTAKERVKAMFLFHRIAEKEGIKVEQQEVAQQVMAMAEQYQMKPEKLVKELEKNNGFQEIHERILSAKVMDFLQLNAKIEEVAAAS